MTKYIILRNKKTVVIGTEMLDKARGLLNIYEINNKGKNKYDIYKLVE